jgi:hypothetical protein
MSFKIVSNVNIDEITFKIKHDEVYIYPKCVCNAGIT